MASCTVANPSDVPGAAARHRIFDELDAGSREAASMLLGMASGLAYLCCSAAEAVDDEPADVTDIVMSLRHITALVREAKGHVDSVDGPAEHVTRALAVCSLATTDIGVESNGRHHQQWNGEITAWSLHSVCDVIKRAKEAVDAPAAIAEEVSHG